MDFFTAGDFDLIVNNAEMPYDTNNPGHQDVALHLKEGVLNKTKHWAEKVVEQLPNFTYKITRHATQHGKKFVPYTWAKIYKEQDDGKCIYFTVGVDAHEEALVYKLDYQFDKSSKLDEIKKEICRDLIKNSDAAWVSISFSTAENYDWEQLIDETVKFIETYTSLYDSVIEQVWANEKRLARLTWNDKGWVEPSGRNGKSTHTDSYEALYGFGHEEWLFDTGKLIDGYHYAFLEPVNKEWNAFIGSKYDVELFSIDGISKKRYYAGEINNVEVITVAQSEEAKNQYNERGWLDQMQEQLRAVGVTEVDQLAQNTLFNIRFRPQDIIECDYVEIHRNNPIYNQSRYVFQKNHDQVLDRTNSPYVFVGNSDDSTDNSNPIIEQTKTRTFDRSPRSVEVTYLHETIQNGMLRHLQEKYGVSQVRKEHPIGHRRVDIVVKHGEDDIFYEIKAYSNPLTSVREAIGQLLEYSYYPQANNAKKLIIVTPNCAEKTIEITAKYVEHLREVLRIPIFIQTFDVDTLTPSTEF